MAKTELRHFRRHHLGRLLAELSRDFSVRVKKILAERGHPGVKPSHTQVFANLPIEGCRLTTLADRAGITKQSMGGLVSELEGLGYLERKDDPEDARAAWVRFSRRGIRLLEESRAITAEVEAMYGERIGKRKLAELKKSLGELVDSLAIDVPV